MKISFLATGNAPEKYEFEGDILKAHYLGDVETIDLSVLEHGDEFEGFESEVISLTGRQVLRDASRDEDGTLHVVLAQPAPMRGHWRESKEYDSSEYVEGRLYIRQLVNEELLDPPWEAQDAIED